MPTQPTTVTTGTATDDSAAASSTFADVHGDAERTSRTCRRTR